MVLCGLLAIILIILIINRFTIVYNYGYACLVGKTVIVTGGNSGIGYECCLEFAARGARVVMAARNLKTAEECKRKIIVETDNTNIIIIHLDLCDNDSVRKFAQEFKNLPDPRLDILVNNAGIGISTLKKNKDGIDVTIQGNYLGHFLLTHCLADIMKKTKASRIIHVSSSLAYLENLTTSNMLEPTEFFGYGNTKLLQIIGSSYLAEKLKQYNITSTSVNPGFTRTNIHNTYKEVGGNFGMWFHFAMQLLFAQSAREAANTVLDAALNVKWNNKTDLYFWYCKSMYKPRKCYDKKFCDDIIKKSIEVVKLQKNEEI